MEKIDVVIVGGGLAGLSCAYVLAEKNMQVIVVERGGFPGSKNITGGRLYIGPIREIAGKMLEGAPFERKVVRERWSLMGEENSIGIDFTGRKYREEDHSYTILRARFDRWLAERLMEKGVFVVPGHRVDSLLWKGNHIEGVRSGKEEIYANVTVAADGALSFMAEEAALKPRMRPRDYAVGIKEIIQLSEEKINDRFNLEQNEGSAHLFTGDVTKGMFGGGFLYTNKETISLGVVVGIRDLMENSPVIETHALMEMFKKRYEIKRFIEGGTVEEYSAHIIPESGYDGISKLYGNGILVAGDAAGFALNMGVTVRGMEFAVASGVFAAESIIRAKECGDYSAQTLSYYEKRLKESFVLQDFYNFRQMPEILENKDFFNYYPNLFPSLVEKIMWFDGESKEKLSKTIWKGLKNSGAFNMKRLKTLYKIKNL